MKVPCTLIGQQGTFRGLVGCRAATARKGEIEGRQKVRSAAAGVAPINRAAKESAAGSTKDRAECPVTASGHFVADERADAGTDEQTGRAVPLLAIIAPIAAITPDAGIAVYGFTVVRALALTIIAVSAIVVIIAVVVAITISVALFVPATVVLGSIAGVEISGIYRMRYWRALRDRRSSGRGDQDHAGSSEGESGGFDCWLHRFLPFSNLAARAIPTSASSDVFILKAYFLNNSQPRCQIRDLR